VNKTLARWLQQLWYLDAITGTWLSPLSFLFSDAVRLRAFLYRTGVLKSQRLPVPVIIVGNITVGGTGKTPLLIWLAERLKQAGFKPGIISRGYGGKAAHWPQPVTAGSDALLVGDEALLIVQRTGCPMAVAPLRVESARWLLDNADCDVLLSDDGLQHYALQRDVEIAVVDGQRRFGNGFCLPAGPLREPIERLRSVDFVVVNGGETADNEFAMTLAGDSAVNLHSGETKPLADFVGLDCHAVAGIGNPDRFFQHLAAAGLRCQAHAFPDHYRFQAPDIDFGDGKPVLMTEKDAVKCRAFADDRHWFVPVAAVVSEQLTERLIHLLKEKS